MLLEEPLEPLPLPTPLLIPLEPEVPVEPEVPPIDPAEESVAPEVDIAPGREVDIVPG